MLRHFFRSWTRESQRVNHLISQLAFQMDIIRYSSAKELIQSLRDETIDRLITEAVSDIDTVAVFLGIDPSYLSVQVRLLLPFHSLDEIRDADHNSPIPLIRTILARLRNSLSNFESNYSHHRSNNGIDILPKNQNSPDNNPNVKLQVDQAGQLAIVSSSESFRLRFEEVDPNVGFSIQENIHYIHKRREDTKFHFGLFLEDYEYPIAYCSFSVCDRNYQASALAAVLGHDLKPEEIFVMTRAYGFNPLPANVMSKLFDKAAVYIKMCNRKSGIRAKFIITALNPFLGFNGGIFLGSSYSPFATSPMFYNFTMQGLYLNRRSAKNT